VNDGDDDDPVGEPLVEDPMLRFDKLADKRRPEFGRDSSGVREICELASSLADRSKQRTR
jgi:hypothetical protein